MKKTQPKFLKPSEMTMRQQGWDDLPVIEKIERMRQIVKRIDYSVSELRQRIDKLEKHSHQDGKIVIPLAQEYGGAIGAKMPEGKVYF